MKSNLVLALLLFFLCSAAREKVDMTEGIEEFNTQMENHYALVDSLKKVEEEKFIQLIENDLRSRHSDLVVELSELERNNKIVLPEYHKKRAQLNLIDSYIIELDEAVSKLERKRKSVFRKIPQEFQFDARIIPKLIIEGLLHLPKIGG